MKNLEPKLQTAIPSESILLNIKLYKDSKGDMRMDSESTDVNISTSDAAKMAIYLASSARTIWKCTQAAGESQT